MTADSQELGAPFFFATGQAPTGLGDRRRHLFDMTVAVPDHPGQVEAIDIILSVDYARAVIAQMSTAVIAVRHSEDTR